jgi:ubiquinone/menaquinone biosynthesis C-methylase UbiE
LSRRFVPAAGRFVPATGLGLFLRWYDPAVRFFTSHDRLVELILHHCRNKQRILDVGCGSGILAIALARDAVTDVSAIDIDCRILAQAQAKPATGAIDWRQSSSCLLPYADAEFDCVVSCLLTHHLTDDEKTQTFQEIRRVTKAGGPFIFADFAKPAHLYSKAAFLPVRIIDGWQRTRANADGSIHDQLANVFSSVQETDVLHTLLGTIRVYVCKNDA